MSNATELKVYYDNDIDVNAILSKKVAVLGFGSQGHAHAQNLKESGANVKVALREGSKTCDRVKNAGLECLSFEEAVEWADVLMILLPDTVHKEVYDKHIAPHLRDGQYLGFGHGFSIHYGQIVPPAGVNTFIVAPKGPGHLVRSEYKIGRGVPTLVAVGQNPSGDTLQVALAYAKFNGGAKGGVIETTFKDETETDLFGEQAVLCGGTSALIKAGFETLVEAGYPPEMAYFECLHELKLIVDLIYYGGISDMRYSISDTARYGDVTRGPRLVTSETKAEMKKILEEIQNGNFAKEWIEENKKGQPNLKMLVDEDKDHEIERVGRKLRGMMSWIKDAQLISSDER
ncbi:MAG TPA: ketol-acid reductoisomerase [Cyanobacteria bacterium UBA9971]|nr:ketol-acid reductoisomerase [Cyanobacteria bacterium UBA9971]